MEFIEDKFTAVEYPFLIMHGEQDKICSVEGSQAMHDQAKSSDKTIKVTAASYDIFMSNISK